MDYKKTAPGMDPKSGMNTIVRPGSYCKDKKNLYENQEFGDPINDLN